jgi:Protein of unknown function (DUF2946)
MDEIVLRAIAKWPDVPSVYGWLSLDRRGKWAMKGERIGNPGITEFIGRNYGHDDRGRWFFQNGPQRVFVTLACTPLIYRTQPQSPGALLAHTGAVVKNARAAFVDNTGALMVDSELGIGLIHDQDLPELVECLTGPQGEPLDDAGLERLWSQAAAVQVARAQPCCEAMLRLGGRTLPMTLIHTAGVPGRFGFDPDPRPAPGEPEC